MPIVCIFMGCLLRSSSTPLLPGCEGGGPSHYYFKYDYRFNPASQFSTTVMGVWAVCCAGGTAARNRLPSAVTSQSPTLGGRANSCLGTPARNAAPVVFTSTAIGDP